MGTKIIGSLITACERSFVHQENQGDKYFMEYFWNIFGKLFGKLSAEIPLMR